jgi:DNA processing protein
MTLNERDARILLNACPAMGPVRFRRLEEAFGSATAAMGVVDRWGDVEGIGTVTAETLSRELSRATKKRDEIMDVLSRSSVRAVIPGDEDYPSGLMSLPDRPFLIFVQGAFRPVDDLSVALVGSRRPTAYGRAVTERLARELAEAGVTVISGLARGIDGVAHETALKKKGRTIGVLGSGFGNFYPSEHRALATRMAENGAVVTEFPWDAEPLPGNFPRRNRLVAGMSLAVVVIEADIKSGALITAKLAAEQGREVFAVPGSIFSPMSRGPHMLLKDGAKPVEGAEDIIEALEVFRSMIRRPVAPKAESVVLSDHESTLLERLSLDPVGTDGLATATGLSTGALASALLNLELKGMIKSLPGGVYVRTEAALKG